MNLAKKQLAIIIMVSTRSYSDLDQYRGLVQNYPSYEEFYRYYARCGNYFDARCYEETKAEGSSARPEYMLISFVSNA